MTMTLASFQRQDEKLMCEKLPAVLNREGRENKHSRRQGESLGREIRGSKINKRMTRRRQRDQRSNRWAVITFKLTGGRTVNPGEGLATIIITEGGLRHKLRLTNHVL